MIEHYRAVTNCAATKILSAGLMVMLTIRPALFCFSEDTQSVPGQEEDATEDRVVFRGALTANCARFRGKFNQNE